jgi:hypothetical protein
VDRIRATSPVHTQGAGDVDRAPRSPDPFEHPHGTILARHP